MALSMDFTFNKCYSCEDDVITKEINYKNVYIIVDTVDGNKNNINFSVSIFEDNTKTKRIIGYCYNFIPSVSDNSANIIKQAYEYLKTLPEYSNCIDC